MIKKRMEMRGQGGFTLIELLVVVAILAILAGVAVFAISNIREKANKNACITEANTMQTAIDAWSVDKDVMPTTFMKDPDGKYFTLGDGASVGANGSVTAKGTTPSGCTAPSF